MVNVFLVFLGRDLATRQALGETFPCAIVWPKPTGLATPNDSPHPEPDRHHRDHRHHDPHEIHLPVLRDSSLAIHHGRTLLDQYPERPLSRDLLVTTPEEPVRCLEGSAQQPSHHHDGRVASAMRAAGRSALPHT